MKKNNNTRTYPPLLTGVKPVAWLFLSATLLFVLCCLTSCSQEEAAGQPVDGIPVSFKLPGIRSEVTENGLTRASLDEGTTVGVVVYKTGEEQILSNIVDMKAYSVQPDGSLKSDTDTDLRLIEGTYDFYALTPGDLGLQPGITIKASVPQMVDFAVSLTTGVKINKWTSTEGDAVKRTVILDELIRKCAKLTFAIDIAEDVAPTITDTKITEATLTNMPSKAQTSGTTTLDASSGTTTLTVPASKFKTDVTNPRKASGSVPVLPKTSGTFDLSMKAQFNGVTSVTTKFPATNVPAMSFDSGKEYTFTIRLTKDKLGNTTAGLWVTIMSKWMTNDQNIGLGGVPNGPISTQLIGEWSNVTWESNVGGVPTGPIITGVSGWWNNIYYNPHLGGDKMESND